MHQGCCIGPVSNWLNKCRQESTCNSRHHASCIKSYASSEVQQKNRPAFRCKPRRHADCITFDASNRLQHDACHNHSASPGVKSGIKLESSSRLQHSDGNRHTTQPVRMFHMTETRTEKKPLLRPVHTSLGPAVLSALHNKCMLSYSKPHCDTQSRSKHVTIMPQGNLILHAHRKGSTNCKYHSKRTRDGKPLTATIMPEPLKCATYCQRDYASTRT